ncbi:hypothetical protein [Saccharopolyspora sp. NPDC002376]
MITVLLASAGVALADRKRGSWSILGALGVSQLSLHVFLQLVASHQDAPGALGMPISPVAMALGHIGVVLFTGLLMARAERALFVVARLLRSVLLRRPRPLRIVTELRTVCIPAVTVRQLAHLVHQRIHALRGPPKSPVQDQAKFAT